MSCDTNFLTKNIMKQIEEEIVIEICNHCGKDVSMGSGNFVNRVPDFNDVLTRIDNNLILPIGDFVCESCDSISLTGNEEITMSELRN